MRRDWGMGQGAKRGHRLYLVRPPGDLRSSHQNSEWGALRWARRRPSFPRSLSLLSPEPVGSGSSLVTDGPELLGTITSQVRSALSPLPIPQNWNKQSESAKLKTKGSQLYDILEDAKLRRQ